MHLEMLEVLRQNVGRSGGVRESVVRIGLLTLLPTLSLCASIAFGEIDNDTDADQVDVSGLTEGESIATPNQPLLPHPVVFGSLKAESSCGTVGNPIPFYFVPLNENTPEATDGINGLDDFALGVNEPTDLESLLNAPDTPDMDSHTSFVGNCVAKEGYRRVSADLQALKYQYLKSEFDFGGFRYLDDQAEKGMEMFEQADCVALYSGLTGDQVSAGTVEVDVHHNGLGVEFGELLLFPSPSVQPSLPFAHGGQTTDEYGANETLAIAPGEKLSLDSRLLGFDRFDLSDYIGSNGRIEGKLIVGPYGESNGVINPQVSQLNSRRYYNYSIPPGRMSPRLLNYEEGSGLDLLAGRRLDNDAGLGEDVVLSSNALIGDTHFVTGYFPVDSPFLETYRTRIQPDFCRVILSPMDPLYRKRGVNDGNSWGERFDDQWAIKRVGLNGSAWGKAESAKDVVVAVIDSGLAWEHVDLDRRNIWHNTDEIPGNGIDDDQNGYVDDIIGWDFVNSNNRPWDYQGHGTFVAGIIAADHNDQGIAGINPRARIMAVKVVDSGGRSRASLVARGIVYAVDNGASVINVSVGGAELSDIERAAIEYAERANVLLVVASGNDGAAMEDFAFANYDHVFTVGATNLNDDPADFSNYGSQVDLVAPGVEVLSLRARMTDTNYTSGDGDYKAGDFVVHDKRYIKSSGTSAAASIVSGIASLVWGMNPHYSAADVRKVLTLSAKDIGLPGRDDRTGYGMVDAQRAMLVDPSFEPEVEISEINVSQGQAGLSYELVGTASSQNFKRAWVSVGSGENPQVWYRVGTKMKRPVMGDVLMTLPESTFTSTGIWQIALHVEDENGVVKAHRKPIRLR